MAITKEEVKQVANLARLELEEASLDKYTSELDSILNYVQRLSNVDTNNVEPLVHAESEAVTPLREDKERDSKDTQDFHSAFWPNAPESEGKFFKVPKMG